MINFAEKRYLLLLARRAIECKLFGEEMELSEEVVPSNLKIKKGVFVTIAIEGRLRGCIGNIDPVKELWKGVVENAKLAAFEDDRFVSLREEELAAIEIEISVLDRPKRFEYDSVEDLIKYLERYRPGVILERKNRKSTFLPQVWEVVENAEEFLNQLCQKAGLAFDEWREGKCRIEVYQVEKFSENE